MSKTGAKSESMDDFERNAYRRLIQHMIRSHKIAADPFLAPVPKSIPGYYDVIKHPMDFTTIRQKLDTNVYKSRGELESDFLLMVANAYTFNHPHSVVHRHAVELEGSFRDSMIRAIREINEHIIADKRAQIEHEREERRLRKIASRRQASLAERRKSAKDDSPEDIQRKLEHLEKALTKSQAPKTVPPQPVAQRALTDKQRELVFTELGNLDPKHFPALKAILSGESAASFAGDTELELDFNNLPIAKQKELFKFVERIQVQQQVDRQLARND